MPRWLSRAPRMLATPRPWPYPSPHPPLWVQSLPPAGRTSGWLGLMPLSMIAMSASKGVRRLPLPSLSILASTPMRFSQVGVTWPFRCSFAGRPVILESESSRPDTPSMRLSSTTSRTRGSRSSCARCRGVIRALKARVVLV